MWCHKLRTHVKIDFQNLSFTVQSQFHHKNHINHTNYQAQDNHMQQHSHNATILARNEKLRHVRYKDDKREVTKYESNTDNSKKKNKNED